MDTIVAIQVTLEPRAVHRRSVLMAGLWPSCRSPRILAPGPAVSGQQIYIDVILSRLNGQTMLVSHDSSQINAGRELAAAYPR